MHAFCPIPGAYKAAGGTLQPSTHPAQYRASQTQPTRQGPSTQHRAAKRSPAHPIQSSAVQTPHCPNIACQHTCPARPILRFAHPSLPCVTRQPCRAKSITLPPAGVRRQGGHFWQQSATKGYLSTPIVLAAQSVSCPRTHACPGTAACPTQLACIQDGQHSAFSALSQRLAAHVLCPSIRCCHAALSPSWIRGDIAYAHR